MKIKGGTSWLIQIDTVIEEIPDWLNPKLWIGRLQKIRLKTLILMFFMITIVYIIYVWMFIKLGGPN